MASTEFDAIVIGSGISGGWAAKELTEKGMKVLMLDRGRMVEHRKDYITEGKGPWQLAYRGNLPPEEVERDYQMAKWGGANLTAQTHTTTMIGSTRSTMRTPGRSAGCVPTRWAASR